jgi:fucose 4-O-acetylase-like acetyltransferase
MPLFFVVSGYLYKKRPLLEQLKKDFFWLLVPYIISCMILTIYGLVADFHGTRSFPHETVRWFIIGFYGSPDPNVPLGNSVGPLWFLLALFWCRTGFAFLHTKDAKKNILYFIILPVSASYLFHFIYIPLYILQGLTAMIFYYIGNIAKEKQLGDKKYAAWIIILMLVVWIYCAFFSHVGMASGYYDNFIMNVCGAAFGSYFVYRFAVFIESKLLVIKRILVYVGKYSLIVLCFHSLDWLINPFMTAIQKTQFCGITQGHFYRYYIGLRFIYIIFILLLVPNIPIVKRLFSRK